MYFLAGKTISEIGSGRVDYGCAKIGLDNCWHLMQEAEEAEKKRKAEEPERKRKAEEAYKKQKAEEAHKKRKAEEAEKKRKAEEAEKKRQAEEKELIHAKESRIVSLEEAKLNKGDYGYFKIHTRGETAMTEKSF